MQQINHRCMCPKFQLPNAAERSDQATPDVYQSMNMLCSLHAPVGYLDGQVYPEQSIPKCMHVYNDTMDELNVTGRTNGFPIQRPTICVLDPCC